MDRKDMSKLYREPSIDASYEVSVHLANSIDASYEVSVHLAKWFQRRFLEID